MSWGTRRALYVAWNGWSRALTATVPAAPPGSAWALAIDTRAEAESWQNAREPADWTSLAASTVEVAPRAVVVLVAR